MESVRRVTHILEVGEPGAIVPLDFLLPSEALECFGLQAMVVGLIPSLESVDDFVIDETYTRLGITQSPNGYLKKIK